MKNWNDPAINKLNPGVTLPGANIAVVHRSDGSGTSFNFTHYLEPGQPHVESRPGEGKTVKWPTGIGGKGNEGVAGYVKQIPNSIGYVEYAYVVQNHMAFAALQNAAGNLVAPSARSFSSAAESADWKNSKDFDLVMTNAPGANAYPITATTFILMPQQSDQQGEFGRGSQILSLRPGAKARRRLSSSIMSRFPRPWCSRSIRTSPPSSSERFGDVVC